MGKKSFLLYLDQSETFNALSNEDAGILIKASFAFQLTGEVPKLPKMLELVFIPMRQAFERDIEKYNKICQRNATNGVSGGRPKNNPKNPLGFLGTQNNPDKPKKPDKEKDNEKDTDNDNKKEKINTKEKSESYNNQSLGWYYKKVPRVFNAAIEVSPKTPRVLTTTDMVRKNIRERMRDKSFKNLEQWRLYFEWAMRSQYLTDNSWADFGWLTKVSKKIGHHVSVVRSGKYHDGVQQPDDEWKTEDGK